MNRKIGLYGAPVLSLAVSLYGTAVHGRDLGQWGDGDPDLRQWYSRQMMPDWPTSSCCGEADAYQADKSEVVYDKDGKIDHYIVTITDERDDKIVTPDGGWIMRPHMPVGTQIVVPKYKLKIDPKDLNPTGHGIIFLGGLQFGIDHPSVYCWIPDHGDI